MKDSRLEGRQGCPFNNYIYVGQKCLNTPLPALNRAAPFRFWLNAEPVDILMAGAWLWLWPAPPRVPRLRDLWA